MTDLNPGRTGMTPAEVAHLGEREALQRLDLLATVGSLLDPILDEYDEAMDSVAETCVADFADLCAVEVIAQDGTVRVAAFRHSRTAGLHLPAAWTPVGRAVAPDRRPVLVYSESEGNSAAHRIRERIGAQSLIVSPITGGGLTLGWFVVATGTQRRGFRPSALRLATELGSRIGTAIQRVMLHREMQASAREQSRTVRRLRRLAAAATNLAGAATPQAVLDTACMEACVIHEAGGAIARWSKADGSTVHAQAGDVDMDLAEAAFESVTRGRVSRGRGWIAYPLPNTDPWQHGALVVFVDDVLAVEEEPVLSSLASLIPVAFERALGTETALKHEARLRAVVDASPVALIEVDPSGFVSMANKTAQDLFGWPSNPGGWELTAPMRQEILGLGTEVLTSGSVSTRTIQTDGRELSVSGAQLPAVYSTDGPSVLVAGVDVTEMRRAEQALVQAQRLDAMGQVAGRVAHDFNNLLTLIIGYASILRRGIDDEKQLSMISNIEAASKRAANLTQQMLDMTRQKVDTGVVIDLGQEIAGLDAVLARVVGPGVDLRVRASRNVIKVRLDPSEMEQIIVNLVINASDAMNGEGRVDVSVRVDAPTADQVAAYDLPGGPLALVAVSDNGPGMTPEVLARCVEPFFTTKDRGRGSGLGLATVYGLVRERGGQMHIDSALTQGTRIRIWLPLVKDAPLSAAGDDDERWPAERTITGRVLLVEDEDDLLRMARDALTSIGLEVVSFPAAEDALEQLDAGAVFDALVTDVILPQMSGVELVKAARQISPDLPVVYMTGYTGSRVIPPGHGDPVIRKPYTPDALRLRVAEVVSVGRVRNSRL